MFLNTRVSLSREPNNTSKMRDPGNEVVRVVANVPGMFQQSMGRELEVSDSVHIFNLNY